MSRNRPIVAIVGPTASGKTELAVAVAKRIGDGEVINCDSVQIYREIEIATAKPTPLEMDGVPHHLIDYVDPRINYTAADWSVDAAETIKEVETRGGTAILAGGTGFYLRTLRQPLFEAPKTDEKLRRRLTEIRVTKGAEHLHSILRRVDPLLAEKLFPKDYPRVQRAVEVYFQTGQCLSDLQQKRKAPPEFASRIRVFALNPPRDELYKIINARAERHFEKGLVDEVRALLAKEIPSDSNALGSHGYRRVCEYLRGERDLESAIEQTKQDVRNYAKRQFSWFKRENPVFLDGFGNDPKIAEKLMMTLATES